MFPKTPITYKDTYLISSIDNSIDENLFKSMLIKLDFSRSQFEKEIQFSKLQGTLDCGMNIIYVVQKL